MESTKQGIIRLVEKYNKLKEQDKIKDYNEAQTISEFIEPLFSYLGWDIHNINNDNEVTPEEGISNGRVDRAFRVNGVPKFFLEAKSMKTDLDVESYAKQAIKYSWNKGVDYAVLTDFEAIKIFNANAHSKSLRDKIIFQIPCENYISNFDKLWLLSKESFSSNSLDKYAEEHFKKSQKLAVSEKLFSDLREAREILTKSFRSWNSSLSVDDLDEGIQRILDRLVFIRVLEDRKLEDIILRPLIRDDRNNQELFHSLIEKFRELDNIYNSSLFKEHACEKWENYDLHEFKKVIELLYGDDIYEYDFKEIPADILGGVYESYLGYIAQKPIEADKTGKSGKLFLVEGKKELKEKSRKKRKEQGIYYTPKFIVDYIVKNTLGEKLKEAKSINDLKKIRVLDPACGSGSFLTKALETINDKYKDFNAPGDQDTKTQILLGNIYGVDLDSQAVELAKLNLLIDALDKKEKLPELENIRVGNSLISGEEKELKKYFGKNWRDKKHFTWEEKFTEVFQKGGFDIIIGNPPYVSFYSKQAQTSDKTKEELEFFVSNYKFIDNKEKLGRFNTVMFFIEKTLHLLKEGGISGFIVDMNIFGNPYKDLRKYLLENSKIIRIVVNLADFSEVGSGQVIVMFQKNKKLQENNENTVLWQDNINETDCVKIKQGIWYNPDSDFNFIRTKDDNIGKLINKIEGHGILSDIYPGKLVRTSITFTGKKEHFLVTLSEIKLCENKQVYPLLEGSYGVSDRYCMPAYDVYVNYDEDLRDKLNAEYVELAQKENKRTPMVIGLGSLDAFKSPKILFRLSSKKITATYSEDVLCADLSLYVIVREDKEHKADYELKYTLAILNSNLVDFYAKENRLLKQEKGGMPQIRLKDLKKLPLYKINFKNYNEDKRYKELIYLSNKMLKFNEQIRTILKNSDKWNSLKEEIERTDKLIDQKVYELYDLTEEEIKIIEKNNEK